LLDTYNLKATFFVVADVAEHYPGLVEQISSRGHEIACHGLHHACKINPKTKKPLMTPGEFEERTLEAKNLLEKVSFQTVIGYRAPSAYIAGWMLDSLEKLGFKYDSSVSVNSLYNKSDSNLGGVDSRPYYPQIGQLGPGMKRKIVELPWPFFSFGLKFPTAGGPMLRFLGAGYITKGLKQSSKRGHSVFYFHPIDIADEKFPATFSRNRPFYWLIKGTILEKRIVELFKSFGSKFTLCHNIIEEFSSQPHSELKSSRSNR
jgi:peptidoglycan-N-acetylglucosamine deacetylase